MRRHPGNYALRNRRVLPVCRSEWRKLTGQRGREVSRYTDTLIRAQLNHVRGSRQQSPHLAEDRLAETGLASAEEAAQVLQIAVDRGIDAYLEKICPALDELKRLGILDGPEGLSGYVRDAKREGYNYALSDVRLLEAVDRACVQAIGEPTRFDRTLSCYRLLLIRGGELEGDYHEMMASWRRQCSVPGETIDALTERAIHEHLIRVRAAVDELQSERRAAAQSAVAAALLGGGEG